MAILEGNEVWSTGPKRTQVYLATHDEEGNRLPLMNRSFISFSYGGKPIEDFNLIATFNDRLEKNVYAEFEDSTSNYETLDGQYFWGTHFQPNQLSFTLSTDGITQQELDNFKRYFMPGVEKELILAEHPNRAILARVSAAPRVSLLPFEEKVTVFNTQISTTLYKGNINLSFVMDEPFWYGKMNYIPTYVDGNSTLNNKDYLKIFLEDGIPFEQQLIGSPIFLGNSILVENNNGNGTTNNYLLLNNEQNTNITVNNTAQYLFYAGTAPAKPIIKFDMTPKILGGEFQIDIVDATDIQKLVYNNGTLYGEANTLAELKYQLNDGKLESTEEGLQIGTDGRIKRVINVGNNIPFIVNPINSIGSENFDFYSSKYSYVLVESPTGEQNYFYFTTPGIWTGYNKAIELINNTQTNEALLELKEHLRDEIKEYYVRAWALKSIEEILNNETTMKDAVRTSLFEKMLKFLQDDENNFLSASFKFDSATGESVGIFKCRNASNPSEIITIEENVGDMVKSPYLLIKEKSNFNILEQIDGSTYYKIKSNETLENFEILYQHMYL